MPVRRRPRPPFAALASAVECVCERVLTRRSVAPSPNGQHRVNLDGPRALVTSLRVLLESYGGRIVSDLHRGDLRSLETVWELFCRDAAWPTFGRVDRVLDKEGIDAEVSLKGLAPRFVGGIGRSVGVSSSTAISLTLEGIAAVDASSTLRRDLVLVVRHLADVEQRFEPEPGGPDEVTVSAAEIVDALAIAHQIRPRTVLEGQVRLAGCVIQDMGAIWTTFSPGKDGAWSVTLSRTVRRYREIDSFDDIVRIRQALTTGDSTLVSGAGSTPTRSDLGASTKVKLESIFGMSGGYVLDLTNATFADLVRTSIGVDPYEKYGEDLSKARLLRLLWAEEPRRSVARLNLDLLEHWRVRKLLAKEAPTEPEEALRRELTEYFEGELDGGADWSAASANSVRSTTEASVVDDKIEIEIHEDIYSHIGPYLATGDYFHAVEEAYKLVRGKLRDITGKERASDAFAPSNIEKIFGHQPLNQAEADFFEGVKFLNMSIQFLRNEKAHTPATALEPNLAIHYIALASLAYDLISRP